MKIEIISRYRNDAGKSGEWSEWESRKYRPIRVIVGKPGGNYPGVETGEDHTGLAERRVIMAESARVIVVPAAFPAGATPSTDN